MGQHDRGRDREENRDRGYYPDRRNDRDRGDRDRDRDRNRDRDRERDRERRDRDRRSPRRRRSRSRSRDRDRGRRSPRRQRSRSRSRDPGRKDRSRSLDRGRRQDARAGSALSSANKIPSETPADNPPADDSNLHPTAPQCCNMLCEMYAEKKTLPGSVLSQCFSSDPVFRLSKLSSGAVVSRGAESAVSALMAAPPGKPKASRTLFVESPDSRDPSLALAFFPPGASPGFTHDGLSKPGGPTPNDRSVALLLRVQRGKINHIWVAEDADGLSKEGSSCGRKELLSCGIWPDVLEVLKDNVKAPGASKLHLNNYNVSTDGVGLGIGETSAAETFSLPD